MNGQFSPAMSKRLQRGIDKVMELQESGNKALVYMSEDQYASLCFAMGMKYEAETDKGAFLLCGAPIVFVKQRNYLHVTEDTRHEY